LLFSLGFTPYFFPFRKRTIEEGWSEAVLRFDGRKASELLTSLNYSFPFFGAQKIHMIIADLIAPFAGMYSD
jgi:hypothetical protein